MKEEEKYSDYKTFRWRAKNTKAFLARDVQVSLGFARQQITILLRVSLNLLYAFVIYELLVYFLLNNYIAF